VAAVLKHLSKIVAEDAENKVNGQNNYYVLSAPNYFTDVERNALLDAARYLKLDYAKFKVALVIFQLY
jgi:molecular chaperone DnaK (HSP70)